jgi:protein disulfide-isomerase
MRIEIWSDIMCPFCYLGKARLEKALESFPGKADVTIEWRSFQLNPDQESGQAMSVEDYLVERKGWSREKIRANHDRIAKSGEAVGIKYDFEKAVVGNSFDAHRLIQFAKKEGRADALEDRLMRGYFAEGKDFSDVATLAALGREAGLDPAAVDATLADKEAFAANVREDVRESQRLGVTGVPFFVFNRKFAVSGAQETETFAKALEKAAAEA